MFWPAVAITSFYLQLVVLLNVGTPPNSYYTQREWHTSKFVSCFKYEIPVDCESCLDCLIKKCWISNPFNISMWIKIYIIIVVLFRTVHEPVRKYPCALCKYVGNNTNSLASHMLRSHRKKYKVQKLNTVLPRLTKIIRSGITFVSRNLR